MPDMSIGPDPMDYDLVFGSASGAEAPRSQLSEQTQRDLERAKLPPKMRDVAESLRAIAPTLNENERLQLRKLLMTEFEMLGRAA